MKAFHRHSTEIQVPHSRSHPAEASARSRPSGAGALKRHPLPLHGGEGWWCGNPTNGFTLIEFIGVLAVISVIAAAVVPSVVKRVDQAALTRESSDLNSISDGLIQSSLTGKQIPALADMPEAIAADLDYSTYQVETNGRRFERVFLVDPNLDIAGAGLPYVQTTDGSPTPPANARVMVLSTIARPLPAINSSDFDSIWTTPKGTVPTALAGTWGGDADDLLIERIELGPLFHKVVLINLDEDNLGQYSVDDHSMASVPGLTRVERYYLDGTVFSFYHPNSTLDSREVIHEDASFVYKNNRWGRRLTTTDDVIDEFGQWVAEFLKPPAPSDPKFAATQQAVINEFYSYLWGYAVWAFGDPNADPPVEPFAGANTSSTPQYPSYTVVYLAQENMATFTYNLIR